MTVGRELTMTLQAERRLTDVVTALAAGPPVLVLRRQANRTMWPTVITERLIEARYYEVPS